MKFLCSFNVKNTIQFCKTAAMVAVMLMPLAAVSVYNLWFLLLPGLLCSFRTAWSGGSLPPYIPPLCSKLSGLGFHWNFMSNWERCLPEVDRWVWFQSKVTLLYKLSSCCHALQWIDCLFKVSGTDLSVFFLCSFLNVCMVWVDCWTELPFGINIVVWKWKSLTFSAPLPQSWC